jgi:hypothetical protein
MIFSEGKDLLDTLGRVSSVLVVGLSPCVSVTTDKTGPLDQASWFPPLPATATWRLRKQPSVCLVLRDMRSLRSELERSQDKQEHTHPHMHTRTYTSSRALHEHSPQATLPTWTQEVGITQIPLWVAIWLSAHPGW